SVTPKKPTALSEVFRKMEPVGAAEPYGRDTPQCGSAFHPGRLRMKISNEALRPCFGSHGLAEQGSDLLHRRLVVEIRDAVLEFRVFLQERQIHDAGGTIALFADDQLGHAFELLVVALVDFFAINEPDQVRILLDRA